MTTTRTVYIVAGIVSGVVALILTLVTAWFVLKPRRVNLPEDVQSKHARTHSMASTETDVPTALPVTLAPPPPIVLINYITSANSAYVEKQSQETPPRSPNSGVDQFTTAPSKSVRSLEKRKTTKSSGLRHTSTNFSERNLQRVLSQRSHRSQFSQRSADSESMYSIASAPLSMHDRVFRVNTLETITASPTTETLRNHGVSFLDVDDTVSPPFSSDNRRYVLTRPIAALKPRIFNHNPSRYFTSADSFQNSAFITSAPHVRPRTSMRHVVGNR